MSKRVMLIANSASMIDHFNRDNINILQNMGYEVTVAANFKDGNSSTREKIEAFEQELTQKGIDTFVGSWYTVSGQSDRMGVRLDGAKIENKNGVDIISDGIATGAVQIPASGTPIIMMADRQTTGGYAKIATVISADLQCMAQAAPGTKIRFVAVSEKEAVNLKKQEENRLKRMEYAFFSVR